MKLMLNCFLLFLAFFTVFSCKYDHSIKPTFDDLSFNFQLLDTNGVATTSFKEGSDIVFEISLTNKKSDTMLYYGGLKCAQLSFKVYQNGSLIGHPHPDNWACETDLPAFQLIPYETKKSTIRWLERLENAPLLNGNYTAKFKGRIALNEPKDWKDINLKINFSVN